MSRYTIFAVIAALCLTTASADLSSASFSASPGKVFDGTTSTGADVATWGTYTAAMFGPGADNTTVYAYGYLVTSGTTITTITSRKLNATLLSNGTAATAVTDAKIGDDAVSSPGTAITSYKTAVGLGTFAIAYVGAVTTCPQVYVSIYTGGSSTPATKAVTSLTCSHCTDATASTTGTGYVLTVTSLFYENSTYYVSWTSTVYTETGGGTGCSSTYPTAISAVAKAQVYSYIQGVTTASALAWPTAAVTIFTGTLTALNTAPVPLDTTIAPTCGPQNYTNSTNFYCVYADALSNYNLKAVKVTVASGTADSGTTIATTTTNPGTAASAATTFNTYTLAGFVYGLYQQGILINNAGSTVASGATAASAWTNALQFYNLTSGATSTTGATAGGIALTGYTNAPTAAGTTFSGAGITYSQGYAILDQYTSSTTTTFEWAGFLANSTANGTKTTVASQNPGSGNWFIDANGALWFGGYTTSTTLTTGYLGKVVAQIYYSAGNVLASFFALLSLMIAALFAF